MALAGEVLILPLEAASWQTDPRLLVEEAEKATATTLSDMMGMAPPSR